MISLPIVTTGITFTEIPDNIAYFMEIGNCTQKCKGCHSPHLQGDTVEPTFLKDIINDCIKAKQQGATAILLLGGTTNGIPINTLNLIIKELSFILPVGIYSGAPVDSDCHKYLFDNLMLKWLKGLNNYRKWINVILNTFDYFVEQVEKEFPEDGKDVSK